MGKDYIRVGAIRGRNGYDPPSALADNECVEALNVDWYRARLARKRGGAAAAGALGVFNALSVITTLFRHVPGTDETLAELWAWNQATELGRMAGSSTFALVTLGDTANVALIDTSNLSAATLNGKLFLSFQSTGAGSDRLHVFDPGYSTAALRRVGFPTPAAPAAPVLAAGAVTDTRSYGICWTRQVSGVTTMRSELSALTAGLASAAQQYTITRPAAPAAPDDHVTHWELYGYSIVDNYATGFRLATTAIATATAVDNNATMSGAAPPIASLNIPPVSWKYLTSDLGRILGFGSWTSTNKQNRLWFTPVVGTSDISDDERVPATTTQTNYIDIGENDGDFPTWIQSFENKVYAFKYRHIYRLIRTGNVTTPYRVDVLSNSIGAIAGPTVVNAEDENGDPAMYWLSHRGPYRLSSSGLQWLGADLLDYTINLAPTNSRGHAVWHADKHQVWFWIPTGSDANPQQKFVFDVRFGRVKEGGEVRGGWSRHTGPSSNVRGAVMFANTLGASMSRDLKPYVGHQDINRTIFKCDTADTNDNTTNFQAYILTKAYAPYGLGINFLHQDALMLGAVQAGVTITLSTNRDNSAETRTATATLDASEAGQTRTIKQFMGAAMGGGGILQFQIGDAAAANNTWQLDEVVIPITREEAR